MESRRLYRWTAVVFAVCIAAGAMLRQGVTAALQTHGRVHMVVHVLLFALLTILLLKSTRSQGLRCLLCMGAMLLGYGTEWFEHLKDGFPIELTDVVADGIGVLITMGTVSAVSRWTHFSGRTPVN